ncbi:hypothetical protein Cgig2_014221 [Carnegiea gigantea]|uniref:Uncharacterized protein n=1 Tax=Carnegiea gigantea TaxID=171969 RepID=A0A9Q1JJB9_9CARY|nr:hypothetical protein Cgig2_014221 [Carnegiea gigantea]
MTNEGGERKKRWRFWHLEGEDEARQGDRFSGQRGRRRIGEGDGVALIGCGGLSERDGWVWQGTAPVALDGLEQLDCEKRNKRSSLQEGGGEDMINEKLSQLPGGKEVTNGNVAWESDIYSQVMKEVIEEERRGRVRGLGLGPSSLASLSSTQYGEHLDDDHDQCSERMKFLEAENKRLQDKLTCLEGQQTEVLAKRATLRDLVDDNMTDDATPSNSIGTQNVA